MILALNVLFVFTCLQRPQLVKGNMQLFSVDQQRSQALEAHAAAFAQFKVRKFTYLTFLLFFTPPHLLLFLTCTHSLNMKYALYLLLNCLVNLFIWAANRFQEMRILLLLFPLQQRLLMLGRLHQSYISSSLVHNQVNLIYPIDSSLQ